MNPDEMKQAVAKAALQYVQPNMVVGIGTGSTANHFIDLLGQLDFSIKGAVASSEASAQRLKQQQIPVFTLNELYQWNETGFLPLPLYVDGADEVNADLHMIKGGGGALTREKIVAAASQLFVCIADQSKQVDTLGAFPLPIEVIPMAQYSVTESLEKLGGEVRLREGFTTDNGNIILDIHGLQVTEPEQLESDMNQITGVVTNGLFAKRPANILLLGGEQGVKVYEGKIA